MNLTIGTVEISRHDDEPLATFLTARASHRCAYDTNANPQRTHQYASVSEKPDDLVHAPPLVATQPLTSAYTHPLRSSEMKLNELALLKHRSTSKTPVSHISTYGKRKDRNKSFRFNSLAAKYSPRTHLFTANDSGDRRELSKDRGFTNMSSEETEGSIFSKCKTEIGENLSSHSGPNVSEREKRSNCKVGKAPVKGGAEASQVNIAKAKTFDNASDHHNDDIGTDDDDSDSTLVGDKVYEQTSSPTPAKKTNLRNNVSLFSLHFCAAQAHIFIEYNSAQGSYTY